MMGASSSLNLIYFHVFVHICLSQLLLLLLFIFEILSNIKSITTSRHKYESPLPRVRSKFFRLVETTGVLQLENLNYD